VLVKGLMLDSLHRRPRGRKLAPVLSALTGGRVGAIPEPPSPEAVWFDAHFWEAAEAILDFISLEGKTVADIGSGDGIIDLALALRGRPRELVGYDVNPTPVDHLLEQAGRHAEISQLPAGLSFRPSDPERIDAPDAAYDVVVTWSVFEHARDPLGLLREMRRIVRPDGVLFLQLWPFYHSHRGSHLWDWFPEPFHHLQQSVEEIEAGVRASDRHGEEWAEYMLAEFRTLNRVTLDELGQAVREAGFSIRELELIGQRTAVPSGLDEFPLSALGIGGVKLLAVPL
jgi:2-polyprenyl-3-methyl-5-hydroxy-6-metoxy-1,4-benzoquinol methylase